MDATPTATSIPERKESRSIRIVSISRSGTFSSSKTARDYRAQFASARSRSMTTTTSMSAREPLHVVPSTSEEDDGLIGFQYVWPLRVSKRLVTNGEKMVLNVSLPFTTALHGVGFTWVLKLCDECVVAAPGENAATSLRQVFLSIYFRDGPADVVVEDVRFNLTDPLTGKNLFDQPLTIASAELSKGCGCPVTLDAATQNAFTKMVHSHINKVMDIRCDFKVRSSLFKPTLYLPEVDVAYRSQRIENACKQFIADVREGRVQIPATISEVQSPASDRHSPPVFTLDEGSSEKEAFAHHRRVFVFGCDQVERECLAEGKPGDEDELLKHVRATFAQVYFTDVIVNEITYFEDFVGLIESIFSAQIAPLKRACEQYICKEVLNEAVSRFSRTNSKDTTFIKKMLIIAERFGLEHLKAVASGVLVDLLLADSGCDDEQIGEMRDELKQMASEISTSCENLDQTSEDALVGSVVDELQSLAQRMRRVSLSHSPSLGSTSSTPPSSSSVTPTNSAAHSPAAVDSPRPFGGDASPSASRFKRVALDTIDDSWYVYPEPPPSVASRRASGNSSTRLLQC